MAYFNDQEHLDLYRQAMMERMTAGSHRRFDEYYKCYPITMMGDGKRESADHGGKVFLPSSALDKLTRLHITYPMLFELINGAKDRETHAGVLEFTADEGLIFLPRWLMHTLLLEAGDLIQVKSTDLPPGTFIKLQPQSTDFLEITDPKAVLEHAFQNFSCLSTGDIFSIEYNDKIYEIAVLEVKPDMGKHAIYTMETDLEVDFAPPVGYVEPEKPQGASNELRKLSSGTIHPQGEMAQRINYDAIKPSATDASSAQSQFFGEGQRLGTRKSSKATGQPDAAVPAVSNGGHPVPRRGDGPQPLRLAPGQLFFGWDIKPLPKEREAREKEASQKANVRFPGMGQNLRGTKIEPVTDAVESQSKPSTAKSAGQKLKDFGKPR